LRSRNANEAVIDTTGKITAGGALESQRQGTARRALSLLAYGSPVGTGATETPDPTAAENNTDATEADEVTQEQQATMANGRPVVVSATLNGTVKFVSTGTTEDKAAFTYLARQGYKLAADGLKYSYTDPTAGLVEGTLTLGSGDSYYIALPADLPKDVKLTITATFEAETLQYHAPRVGRDRSCQHQEGRHGGAHRNPAGGKDRNRYGNKRNGEQSGTQLHISSCPARM
jgi:hypothetical protein